MLVIGSFFVVSVMSGGMSGSATSGMYNDLQFLNDPRAAANAVILLVIVLLIAAAIFRFFDVRKELVKAMQSDTRPWTFYVLTLLFACFVVFLYGPMISVLLLSFQGPQGGLSFPLRQPSLVWSSELVNPSRAGDVPGAFSRSLPLALIVTVLTVPISVSAGFAFRRRFFGSSLLFYCAVASLIVPGLVLSIGIVVTFLRLQMRGELKALQNDLGITFVNVTHTQSEAIALADQVVVMDHGRIEQSASAIDIFSRPRTPYVTRFMGGRTCSTGGSAQALAVCSWSWSWARAVRRLRWRMRIRSETPIRFRCRSAVTGSM